MKTVLVVEDEENILRIVVQVFKKDYSVVTATNGETGIRVAKELQPDLIIMDLAMPEVGGIEAIQVIRADPNIKETPILLFTALGERDPHVIAVRDKVQGFISKPFDIRNLCATVARFLDQD